VSRIYPPLKRVSSEAVRALCHQCRLASDTRAASTVTPSALLVYLLIMLRDDGFDAQARELRTTILDQSAELDPARRREAFEGTSSESTLAAFCAKVANRAYTVTDDDIDQLRHAGYSEDQLFEATICAAVGAGFVRLEKGLAALESVKR